jgi:two-component sensor histidine kinase
LQHRTGNLLAVVQAIARISLSGAGSLDQAKLAFEARLQALARAHRHLTESNWRGVNLSDLVHESLEPFAAQTTIDGPSVIVGAQQAQNFSLAIHELATNAIKYGALSNVAGQVSASWNVSADGETPSLNFRWRERGGPPVIAPTRRGFGSSLLRATFDRIKVDYASEGLTCDIQVSFGKAEASVSPPVIAGPLEQGKAPPDELTA